MHMLWVSLAFSWTLQWCVHAAIVLNPSMKFTKFKLDPANTGELPGAREHTWIRALVSTDTPNTLCPIMHTDMLY